MAGSCCFFPFFSAPFFRWSYGSSVEMDDSEMETVPGLVFTKPLEGDRETAELEVNLTANLQMGSVRHVQTHIG